MGVPPPVGQAGARSATGGALRAAEADLSRRMTDPCNPTRPASTSTRDPVIPLAKQRRSILNKLRPIENAYANMHPECAREADTNAQISALHADLEAVESKMASPTARSLIGLIEQMKALDAHICVEVPERAPLAKAVLRSEEHTSELQSPYVIS